MEAEIQDYFNTSCCSFNLSINSRNWTLVGVTDKESFELRYGVTIGNFLLKNGNIKAEVLNTSGSEIAFDESYITNVEYITITGLKYLTFFNNEITTFNPTKALPKGLLSLGLNGNQITTFDPTIELPSTLNDLGLSENRLTNFNPTLNLPVSLTYLGLYANLITESGYTVSENWASSQPTFTNTCSIDFSFNIDSVDGTNLKTILLTKNTTVTSGGSF